jgi:hypothetical protein
MNCRQEIYMPSGKSFMPRCLVFGITGTGSGKNDYNDNPE